MINDWVHVVDNSPVFHTLLQMVKRVLVLISPPACTNFPGMLSAPADFTFLSDFTAASTSSPVWTIQYEVLQIDK